MSNITVRGPDGSVHSFPPGTDEAVIRRVLARRYGNAPEQRSATASAATATAQRTGRRNVMQRFGDVLSDTWNTSWVAENLRAGRVEGAALQRMVEQGRSEDYRAEQERLRRADNTGLVNSILGGNIVRSIGRAQGTATEALFDGTTERYTADVETERTRRQTFADINDADIGGDSFLRYQREGDYVGLAAHGTAALLGTLAGAALDPVSYVSAGRNVVTKAATQAILAGGVDYIAQDAGRDIGLQDDLDYGRMALSAAAGGTFEALGDVAGRGVVGLTNRYFRHPEADVAADLDATDDLNAPALSETEVEAFPALMAPPAREAEEGITVETPDGQVFDVPNEGAPKADEPDPEASPATEGVPVARSGNPEGSAGSSSSSTGNGEGGWDDVDWSRRRSPERAKAAAQHLEKLRKWIRPEAVNEFVRRMDAGIDGATEGTFLNARWVDWDSFNESPEDLIGLHNVLADVFKDLYQAAGVKTQSWDQLKKVAKQMGVSQSDIIKAHADVTGEGGLAVKMFAMRDAFNASVDDAAVKMKTTLEGIRNGTMDASAVREVAELIQRSAILGSMDASVSGEIGRALNSRKALSQPRHVLSDLQAAMDALNDTLNASDGLKTPADVEKVLDDLLKGYDKKGAAGFNARLRKMRAMGVMDYIGYAAVANLLSGIPTHVKNAVGTPTHATLNLASKFVAAGVVAPIRQAALKATGRTSRSVTVRDTVAYMEGTIEALGEGLRLGFEAFKKGAPVADNVSGVMTDTANVPFAYSNARLQKWVKEGPSLSTIGDVIGVAYFEVVRTFGFRPSVAVDEFNKALGRRAELRALALREATYAAAKIGPGKEADRAFNATQKAILAEPTAEALSAAKNAFKAGEVDTKSSYDPDSAEFQMQAILKGIDVRQAALEHSQLLAYQRTGPLVESLEKFLRRVPIVKHFAANFVRTPTQLFVAAFRDYNPITAPIVLGFEATSPVGRARHKAFFDALAGEEDAINGGGAGAEMVIARQIVGAAILGTVWGVWANGDLVGAQVPEGEEYAKVLPYSVRLPNGEWVQYTGFSPLAEHLGLVADMGAIMRAKDTTDDQDFALMGALAVAVRGNVFNKSFLKGISDFMDLMSGGDYASDNPGQTEASMARGAASLILGRVIPLSSFMKRLADASDTDDQGLAITRDARSWMEQMTAYLPGRRETLAIKRDFMGRPVLRQPGEVGPLQAAKTSRPSRDPLEIELHNLAARPTSGLDIRPTPSSIDGVKLDAQEHNRLQEVQGQLYRDPRTGRNMEEQLRHLITTPEYQEAGGEYRETLIKKVVTDYRRAGKKAAFNPDSELYMSELAARIAPDRLRRVADERGWSLDEAIQRRGRDFGISAEDQGMLEDALAATE